MYLAHTMFVCEPQLVAGIHFFRVWQCVLCAFRGERKEGGVREEGKRSRSKERVSEGKSHSREGSQERGGGGDGGRGKKRGGEGRREEEGESEPLERPQHKVRKSITTHPSHVKNIHSSPPPLTLSPLTLTLTPTHSLLEHVMTASRVTAVTGEWEGVRVVRMRGWGVRRGWTGLARRGDTGNEQLWGWRAERQRVEGGERRGWVRGERRCSR